MDTPPTSPTFPIGTTMPQKVLKKSQMSPMHNTLPLSPNKSLHSEYLARNPVVSERNQKSLVYLKEDLQSLLISPTKPTFISSSHMLDFLGNHYSKENIMTRDDLVLSLLSKRVDFPSSERKSFNISSTQMGSGNYSIVYEMTQQDGQTLILKFPKTKRKSKFLLNEALILAYLHDGSFNDIHIVPMDGISYINKSYYKNLRYNENVPCLILEKFDLNLKQLIAILKKNGQDISFELKKKMWWKLFKELMMVFVHLKSRNVVHGDIKTSNILVKGTELNEDMHFYICDFTSSFINLSNDEYLNENVNHEMNHSNFETTLEYCPPQFVETFLSNDNFEFSYETDLYSFGLVLLSYITEEEPFKELQSLRYHSSDTEAMPNGAHMINTSNWLINVIQKNDPINLNINYKTHLLEIWSVELSIVSKILVDRISLEDCMTYVTN
ncbi:hypothetical protein KAFR_0D04250 [Kazachstania africana CBS 2517]|uniref:Protein kinase domain-containing protein n=1 Tax=Kazachstania africana (strain ATCC 22294 / BCRC 22015 / CBS 2517 / CECT 1963 / NBRC 1671 / NRRL Y-8276) TaxID=1071382 RepID=H2AUM3_KAZAF|nr:hypothetical protein KAFR_0D04250 [Kazachstania africana CBS 2517]CCF58073.1 hypothetical protein KAFR_0D04250 [Kazachstania africana CBS 2517]